MRSGLAMMVDIFSNVLAGMPFGPHINKMYGEMDSPRKLGHFVLALDIDRLIPLEGFKNSIGRMTQELTALEPAAGFSDVFYPGQIEAQRRKRRAAEGIPLDRGLLSELVTLGAQCGVQRRFSGRLIHRRTRSQFNMRFSVVTALFRCHLKREIEFFFNCMDQQ